MNDNAEVRSTRTRRRLAPHARGILAKLAAGRYPNLYCFAGSDAWRQARRRVSRHGPESAMLLPPGESPSSYIWPCVDALVLIPGDCDGARLRDLIREFLAAGCRCVVEVRPIPNAPGHAPAPICHYARTKDAEPA